ncbi:unnamed protein product [Rangifer tarandus platyrhynchus]|uniref:Uncharacterized protein n=1 Tax=Rangifer tarandus platyrhynchus TaxID=3082113 RepID=A0AC60A7F9_RANTA
MPPVWPEQLGESSGQAAQEMLVDGVGLPQVVSASPLEPSCFTLPSWCARPHSPGPSVSKSQPVLLPTCNTTIHDTVKNPSHAAKYQPAFIFSTHRKDSLKNNTDSVKEHFCIATCPALCRKKPLLARLMEDRHLSDVFGKMMDLRRSVPSQLAWSPL